MQEYTTQEPIDVVVSINNDANITVQHVHKLFLQVANHPNQDKAEAN